MNRHTVQGGGGIDLHVREWGNAEGPPILLIHGWSQSHLCWEKQFNSSLADDFHLVALDIRGHGQSAAPLGLEHYDNSNLWADDIAAIIEQLNLARPVLVGWSYGGLIIGDYLRIHGQEHIAGICYAGAASVLNESAFGRLIGPGFLDNFEDATADDLPRNIAAMRQFLQVCFAEPLPADDYEVTLAYNMVVPAKVRLNLGSRDLDNTDVLQQLKIPVLIAHGREDNIVLPAAGEYIAEHCSTAKLSWYDGVAHAPFLEAPQRFNRELATFTQECQT